MQGSDSARRGPMVLLSCFAPYNSRAVHQGLVNAGVRNLCAKEPERNPCAKRIPCAKVERIQCTRIPRYSRAVRQGFLAAHMHQWSHGASGARCPTPLHIQLDQPYQDGPTVLMLSAEAVDGADRTRCGGSGWCWPDVVCGQWMVPTGRVWTWWVVRAKRGG